MKLNNSFFYTLRENAKDEESISGNLLVRAGMIKKVGAGIYMYLPLGLRVLEKIKRIVREEMNKAGAEELLMPSLIPQDYYEASNRAHLFGSDMFKLNDRFDHPYVLGPTHEELFTIAAKQMVKSYKDLPFILYQQADKFRDEPRARYGLIRVREFIMKDAYSFDQNEDGLDISYNKMKTAYNNIFARMGINYKIVKSDTGAMGGSLSEEYQALTDIGEDVIVLCDNCDYASNLEVAKKRNVLDNSKELSKELVATPDKKTIEEVSNFLNIDLKNTIKALLMNVDNELITFFVRGDRNLNLLKVQKLLKATNITYANDELIRVSNAVPGFTGPIDLNTKIVIDEEIMSMKNFVCGANKKDYHYINVNLKDFQYDLVGDISDVIVGDLCPHCSGNLFFKKGIEVGNLFKLGTKYSECLDLTYLDENNQLRPVTMGCYGIGIGRILASVIEQNNDEAGIIFPLNIAPYQVSIVLIDGKNSKQQEWAEKIYQELTECGIEVLLDNRDERPGVKFKDMDLIGIPIRVTIGKKLADNFVELKFRDKKESEDIAVSEIGSYINNYVRKNMK